MSERLPHRSRRPHRPRQAAPLHLRRRAYQGLRGDTLASALLANGVHLVGRSFKYHRPRGILAAGSEEPNALVDRSRRDGRAPRRTCAPRRSSSTTASSPRARTAGPRSPSTSARSTTCCRRCSPAGFYYKTFMWPAASGRRSTSRRSARAAGLGKAPSEPDPDRYPNRYAHCDVLVVGAGPAGLAAALAAAEAAPASSSCDEQAELGGSLLSETARDHRRPAGARLGRPTSSRRCALNDRVTLLPRTTAFGYYADNFVALAERVTDHLADAGRRRCRASGSGRCAPRRWCSPPAPSSARWSSRTTTGPASCWPTRPATYAQPLRRASRARAPSSSPPATPPIGAALDLQGRRRRRSPSIADLRPEAPAPSRPRRPRRRHPRRAVDDA